MSASGRLRHTTPKPRDLYAMERTLIVDEARRVKGSIAKHRVIVHPCEERCVVNSTEIVLEESDRLMGGYAPCCRKLAIIAATYGGWRHTVAHLPLAGFGRSLQGQSPTEPNGTAKEVGLRCEGPYWRGSRRSTSTSPLLLTQILDISDSRYVWLASTWTRDAPPWVFLIPFVDRSIPKESHKRIDFLTKTSGYPSFASRRNIIVLMQ
jgi:hypothetical protein